MAYRFSTGDQPVSNQIHRIFLEEIDSATNNLAEANADDRDTRVHEARKSIKKTRALLRLVSDELGKGGFRRENRHFRDIGRKLSVLRDAQAMLESFAALPEETISGAIRTEVHAYLEAAKAKTHLSLKVEEVLRACVDALQDSRPHLQAFSLGTEGFSLIKLGLLRIYRHGRKALKAARHHPSAENLHDFRKRVKDHWYHTRLLSAAQIPFLEGRQDALRELETYLGESHNLHVLQQAVKNFKPGKKLAAALQAREHELGAQALMLGEELYKRKTRQVGKELLELADIWPNSRRQRRATAVKPPARAGSPPVIKTALA